MNRDQLAEVLRAASQIVNDRPIVMGSQAILGSYEASQLPAAATVSMEVDVAYLDDPDRFKADLLTGAIGEDSNFHQLRGYYAEGIHVETAALPPGWRDRLIHHPVPAGHNGPGTVAAFLEPHDLAVAKLAAFREKDVRFVTELVKAELLDPHQILERLERLDHTELHPVAHQRATSLLEGLTRRSSVIDGEGHEAPDPAVDARRLQRSQTHHDTKRSLNGPGREGPGR